MNLAAAFPKHRRSPFPHRLAPSQAGLHIVQHQEVRREVVSVLRRKKGHLHSHIAQHASDVNERSHPAELLEAVFSMVLDQVKQQVPHARQAKEKGDLIRDRKTSRWPGGRSRIPVRRLWLCQIAVIVRSFWLRNVIFLRIPPRHPSSY